MRQEIYRTEVEEVAKECGIHMNDIDQQQFILRHSGHIETELTKTVKRMIRGEMQREQAEGKL